MLQTRVIPPAEGAYQYPLLIKRLLMSGTRYEKTREIIYRDKLRRQGVVFVYMQGTFDEVMERLSHRQGHFMKPSMLQSQSDILEESGDDEIHVNVHIGQADPEHEAMAVAGALGL